MFDRVLNMPLNSATHCFKNLFWDWFSCNVNLLVLKLKHNYYILRLTLTKKDSNDWNLTYLNKHDVYYEQFVASVIHIETNLALE